MLDICEFSLSYPGKQVLESFRLCLAPGTVCAITGANGCGKSTLLSAISGVIPEHISGVVQGSITLEGTDLTVIPLKEKHRYLWHAFANPDSQFFFPTCETELAFALENMGIPPAQIRQRVDTAAAFFGLEHELQNSPLSLSGGQKKLLLCAIGMAISPRLYLLDEPAAGLSASSTELLCKLLTSLKQQGCIVLVAEHNPAVISLADSVIDLGHIHD